MSATRVVIAVPRRGSVLVARCLRCDRAITRSEASDGWGHHVPLVDMLQRPCSEPRPVREDRA